MSKSPQEQHFDSMNQFIDLANSIKDQGVDINIIASAMISATSLYNTYTYAGNDGFLQPAGVDKVAAEFRRQMDLIQQRKKADLKQQGHDVSKPSPAATASNDSSQKSD